MAKGICVSLMVLLLAVLSACGPYRCPEEELPPVQVIEAEPQIITEYVEVGKEELALSMSYVLFYASGRYMPSDASADVIAQIEDEILTWGGQMREANLQMEIEKTLVWGSVDGQPLSPNLYNTLKQNYTFSFPPPEYNAGSAHDEGNKMLSEARAQEMASYLKQKFTEQGITVNGEKEIGASQIILAKRGEINPMARRVTIRVQARGKKKM
jgi:hypothetical protein